MKFTCNKSDMTEAVNIVLKAVPGKTTMPILECVVIEAAGDQIKLTTNDMQLGIETRFPAQIEEDGIILVNAKMMYILKQMTMKIFSCSAERQNSIFPERIMKNFQCFRILKKVIKLQFHSLH